MIEDNSPTAIPHLPFSRLPSIMTRLMLRGTGLTSVPKLLPNLVHLDLSDNRLTYLGRLPESLLILDVSWNALESLIIPGNVERVCIHHNIKRIPNIPPRVRYLEFHHNPMEETMFMVPPEFKREERAGGVVIHERSRYTAIQW